MSALLSKRKTWLTWTINSTWGDVESATIQNPVESQVFIADFDGNIGLDDLPHVWQNLVSLEVD
jgi:hypothetical protein